MDRARRVTRDGCHIGRRREGPGQHSFRRRRTNNTIALFTFSAVPGRRNRRPHSLHTATYSSISYDSLPCAVSRMKILHLAPHCREDGNGVVNVAVDYACLHAAAGHSVGFASSHGSLLSLLENYGVQHFAIDQDWARPISLAKGFFKLQRVIDQFKPDIVHAHAVPGALLASCLRGRSSFRLVTSIHSTHRLSVTLMGVGDAVVAVSSAAASMMRRWGVPEHKLRVVKNGPLASPRRSGAFLLSDSLTVRPPAIVTVAGLLRNKGISDLIAAFTLMSASVPEASLYIVGRGPERSKLEAQAAASGCADRIHFTGFIKDPRPYLFAADIFVLASYHEAFGLVLAEAREARCAVVASDVGGIREALDDGDAGILLPAGQPHILANTLASLLGDHRELERWKTSAAQNLGWLLATRAASETLGVYKEAIRPIDPQGDPSSRPPR
jgi:glycosyltransferase involved in cell wall biosynthesis